jgi:hypothetical protein
MNKKKKKYQKPEITSERVFEETALQCTVTATNLSGGLDICDCMRKAPAPDSIRS